MRQFIIRNCKGTTRKTVINLGWWTGRKDNPIEPPQLCVSVFQWNCLLQTLKLTDHSPCFHSKGTMVLWWMQNCGFFTLSLIRMHGEIVYRLDTHVSPCILCLGVGLGPKEECAKIDKDMREGKEEGYLPVWVTPQCGKAGKVRIEWMGTERYTKQEKGIFQEENRKQQRQEEKNTFSVYLDYDNSDHDHYDNFDNDISQVSTVNELVDIQLCSCSQFWYSSSGRS